MPSAARLRSQTKRELHLNSVWSMPAAVTLVSRKRAVELSRYLQHPGPVSPSPTATTRSSSTRLEGLNTLAGDDAPYGWSKSRMAAARAA